MLAKTIIEMLTRRPKGSMVFFNLAHEDNGPPSLEIHLASTCNDYSDKQIIPIVLFEDSAVDAAVDADSLLASALAGLALKREGEGGPSA